MDDRFSRRTIFLLLTCWALFGVGSALAQSDGLLPPGMLPEGPYSGFGSPVARKGEVLVRLQPRAFSLVRESLKKKYNIVEPSAALLEREIALLFGLRTSLKVAGSSFLVKGTRVNNTRIAALRNRGVLSRAEPNYKVNAFLQPNDLLYRLGFLWGLNNTGALGGKAGFDIDASEAWDVTLGSSDLVVAVVDTGVFLRHPDLVSNIWSNPNEVARNGIDDDRNGYVDDVNGWDVIDNDPIPNDQHFHGTHCAGIIAASLNNNRGMCGVAPGVKVLPLRVLNARGEGDTAGLLKALHYVVDLRRRGVNVRIISASLGGGEYLESFKELFDEANRLGIVVVAAAGNDGNNNDQKPTYPASYSSANIISVAALDQSGKLAGFSNYGANSVDVGAPGVGIWSSFLFGFYLPFDGTSMAAPFVSGTAALLLSQRPSLSPSQVISIIKRSSTPMSSLNGKMTAPGMINAARALQTW